MSDKKKRDKKRFSRENVRYKNIDASNPDDFFETDIHSQKKAAKRITAQHQKSRKSNLELQQGRVVLIASNYRCQVELPDGTIRDCVLGGRLKQLNLTTRGIVTAGDLVNIHDIRVEEVLPRTNTLTRYSEDSFQTEIVIAANLDQVIITTSWSMPYFKPRLVDRYLCYCELHNLPAIIVINKADLAQDRNELNSAAQVWRKLGIKVILASTITKEGIQELENQLKDKVSVFSGQSGTGKSSLINALQPQLNLAVGEVSSSNEKGCHTTTATKVYRWDFGGNLVDTPGIKTFTLRRDDKELIPRVFPDFVYLNPKCQYANCTHTHEENCGIKNAVTAGELNEDRYESFISIYESL